MASPLDDLVFAVAKGEGFPTAPLGGGWEVTVPAAAGRSQSVTLQAFSFEEAPFVRFSTRVGSAAGLSPQRLAQALELNHRLPHGCLAIDAGHLVMTETLPLDPAAVAHTAAIVRFLASQADLYEHVLFAQDKH